MAAVKMSSISTFTIFLTLLLLSSRIYCQFDGDDDDCDDDDGSGNPTAGGGPGPGPGPGPGRGPGSGPGSGPGRKPGPGSNPGSGPGGNDLNQILLNLLGKPGSGSNPGSGPGGNDLDPAFFQKLSDCLNQIGNILVQMLSTLTDAAGGGLGDPTIMLSSLFQQLAQPLSNLLDILITGFTSLSVAATSQIFDALPQQFSQMFRGPIETVINNVYDILYGIDDVFKAVANKDGAGVVKGLGDVISGLTNFITSSGSLLSSL